VGTSDTTRSNTGTVEDFLSPKQDIIVEESEKDVLLNNNSEEQMNMDNVLLKLLFTAKNITITPGVEYDPALSLVNDNNDDD
jgi:hypothetical protein